MLRTVFFNSFRFALLILFQIVILNNINIAGIVNPYIYILFIMMLPFETPGGFLLIASFFTGFAVDFFSHQQGLHTIACVLIGFARPSVLRYFAPRDGYEKVFEPNIYSYGFRWFVKYVTLLTLIHHFVLFYLEIFRFTDFLLTLSRVVISAFFSVILIILYQYLFYRR